MSSQTINQTTKPKISPSRILSTQFVDLFRAYMECSDEVQAAIRDMVEIVQSSDATDDEVEAAISTIEEALFPKQHKGDLGIDLEDCDGLCPDDLKIELEEVNEEEATFATALQAAMEKKGMTQAQLAKAIDVGQPAISMMLTRQCRPQRRTVEKLARALGVTASELWPTAKDKSR